MLWAVLISYVLAVLSLCASCSAIYRVWILEGRVSNDEDVIRVIADRLAPPRRADTAEPF